MVKRVAFYIFLLFVFTSILKADNSFAQFSNTGTVVNIEINDVEATVGDILSVGPEGIVRSITPYDEKIYGVIVESPVVSTGERTANTVPVISSGKALVKVSTGNGPISAGDFITTSQDPGVGQRATDVGFVVGRALEPYSQEGVNLLPVQISVVEFGKKSPGVGGLANSLLGSLSLGLSNADNFPLVLRYVSASLVGLFTFAIAAISFLRFLTGGVQAIGRNPMARRVIIAGMILNAIIVGLLTLAGFGIAIAIVVL